MGGIPIGDVYRGYGSSLTTSQKSGITTTDTNVNKDTDVIVTKKETNSFLGVFIGIIILLILLNKY